MTASATHLSLLGWLDEARSDASVHFLAAEGRWHDVPYPRLAERCRSALAQLRSEGIGPGDVVVLVMDTGPDFAAALFGALLAGATPCPTAPLSVAESANEYVSRLQHIVTTSAARVVLTDSTARTTVEQATQSAGANSRVVVADFGAYDPADAAGPPGIGLLQFTSGSSGAAKGARVSFDNLEQNITMIARWLEAEPSSRVASWLPMFHDMGLIGGLLMPAACQLELFLMRPDQFVRQPRRWLECMGALGCTLTASPPFGLGLVNRWFDRRPRDSELVGMDFSGWRSLVLGAERMNSNVLACFASHLAPFGFHESAFRPAYGLAEATLAVTGVPAGQVSKAVLVRSDKLRFGGPVSLVDEHVGACGEHGWLHASGEPLDGITLEILGPDEATLPADHLGEIAVSGGTVCDGYLGDPGDESRTRIVGGVLRTGDAGFLHDGSLYVLGRVGDSIRIRGRSVYAEELEALLTAVPGGRRQDYAVLPSPWPDGEGAVLVVERDLPEWLEGAVAVLRSRLGSSVRLEVVVGGPGSVLRTTSGKPRRRPMWERLLAGELERSARTP